MADLSRNAFRKGARIRTIHEDPTYLTFMFLFHQHDHPDVGHSPLLDGSAERYLTQVVRTDVGEKYAENLRNFNRVLMKVNKEMPWFWQSLKGLEVALNYGDMLEPWRGAEKPALEIECLEENVELTAIGLMDLYKRACFDFERFVEVVPRNLREFTMDVYVSEIRVFQKDTDARNLGITDNPDSRLNSANTGGGTITELHKGFNTDTVGDSAEARPFLALRFTHCEWDINSIADYFADMTRNPEAKRPTLKINWGTCRQINQKLGPNLFNENVDAPSVPRTEDLANTAVDPKQTQSTVAGDSKDPSNTQKYVDLLKDRTLGKVESTLADTRDSATAAFGNLKDSVSLDANGLDNVHGNAVGGAAANLLNQAEEAVLGRLLLGNVHGLGNKINNIAAAIQTGSLNSIANVIGDLVGAKTTAAGALGNALDGVIDNVVDFVEDNVYDPTPPDTDGPISPKRVYDDIPPDQDGPINENVHE